MCILLFLIQFYSGGFDSDDFGSDYRKNILEYNLKNEKWTEIGTMKEGRYYHEVSIIDFADYEKYCTDV